MPATYADLTTGRVRLDALARSRGSLHTLTGRDPQTDPDHDTDPPVVRKGQCVSGKRVFYAERLANRAVTNAAKRGELPPMRHYACPDCGYWHLSRKASR